MHMNHTEHWCTSIRPWASQIVGPRSCPYGFMVQCLVQNYFAVDISHALLPGSVRCDTYFEVCLITKMIHSSTASKLQDIPSIWPRLNNRLLQGWDHTDSDLRWNIPVWGDRPMDVVSTDKPPEKRRVPHSTMLPGLQFSLAGILGKPETFYQVPVIRFIYEIFGYM